MEVAIMPEIGKRIKIKREELHMTQEELAAKLGYKSKTTIAKIENGTNDIVQSKVVAFASVLNTTPAYLMGGEESPAAPDSLPSDQQQLNDIYSQLDRPNKKKVLIYSKNLLSTQQMEEALIPNAAHAFNPTEEEKKHADDIMKDDSFWE